MMPLARLLLASAIALALQAPLPAQSQKHSTMRLDRFGDPLPVGALARLGTVRFHHAAIAAYSPDGKIIATAEREEVSLWDVATSKKIRSLPIEKREPTVGLIFSHDSKKLAVIAQAGTSIQVWDLATVKKSVLHQSDRGSYGGDWGSAAAFSSNDRFLFAATSTTVFVWDTDSETKFNALPFLAEGKPVDVRMVAFSENGEVAATEGEKKVHLWSTRTGKILHKVTLLSHGDIMRFSPDGKTLVVTARGHWMNLFSVETGKKVHSLVVAGNVVSVAFSRDGKTLVAASNDVSSSDGEQVVQLWNLGNLQVPPEKYAASGIHSVMFSPDGKTLAWGSHGQTLCFMDRATGKDQRPTASHRGAIRSLVYLPDGKRIVSASEDSAIRIWDANTSESLAVLEGHIGPVLGLALYPNGKILASCGRDGTFRLWDIERGKSLAVLQDEGNWVVAAAFSADGKQLASGGNRGVLFLRDPATGTVVDEFQTGSIASLAFSPDGKTLAALCERNAALRLLNLVAKKTEQIPLKHGVSSLAYSRDGRMLAVAGDETLLLLDALTNRVLKSLPGHFNRRGCVAFSADSRYLASVSDGYGVTADRSLRVFEMATGTEIYSFKREWPIFATAFSPDGSKLVVGGADGTALIFELNNLSGMARPEQLTESELAVHWKRLAETDAAQAYEARAELLHAPKVTLSFLANRLEPVASIDPQRVEGWIKDLGSEAFRQRDEASTELGHLGELAGAAMRRALTGALSLEARRRLQALVERLDQLTPSQIRQVRAVEILDGIGTPEALQVIERLTRGNADGLLTIESRRVIARRQKQAAPLPPNPVAQLAHDVESQPIPAPGPVLPDLDGDPMPVGALARLGSARWRLASEPRRILVSADGKRLAVVNNFSGVELFDAKTGKCIEGAKTGFFGWGFDLRGSVALSADWRKLASLEAGKRSVGALAVHERGTAKKLTIEFARPKDSHPAVPEEVEATGSFSTSATEYLSAAEWSPDGKMLVGAVRFQWECETGNIRKEVNETHLIAWDASTGRMIWRSLAKGEDIHTILFSPNGKTTTAVDRTGVGFWDQATGRPLHRWQSKDPLICACYSPDRLWLATGSADEILIWDVATGKVLRRLAFPGKEIKAIAFSADGKLLAGGGDKIIRFWDPLTGKSHGECTGVSKPVETVAFSRDGKTLFSGHTSENALRRWDVATCKPSGDVSGSVAPAALLWFSPDSRRILSSSTGEDFYLWDAETGKAYPLPHQDRGRFLTECLASSGQAALLRCEEGFGRQFAVLLTGKADRLDQLPGFVGSSIDGERVLVQSEKEKAPCFTIMKASKNKDKESDKTKGDIEREFIWKEGNEVSAALTPDGKTVVVAGKDVVCFFDVITGRERRYAFSTNVQSRSFFHTQSIKPSADGSRIALVGSGNKVRILAVKDGRRITDLVTKSGNATGLAFSPDGQTLLTTTINAPTCIWEVATGQMVRRLPAASYLYSPDNRMLAGSADTTKLFELYSGRVLRECKAEGNGLGNTTFSPNAKLLAASSSDTTILVWPTSAADAKPGTPLEEHALAEVLEKGNATDAYAAIGRMIADPERALSFLEHRLRSAPKLDAQHVQRLIEDLANDQAKKREAAVNDLTQLGAIVEPLLRDALSSTHVALDSKKRIEQLLQDWQENPPAIADEDVFHIRSIQVLERIGSNRARQLLEVLAKGSEFSPRTAAAVEALARIGVR